MTEDEMVGWHHRFNGHGLGWTAGVGDGQEGLASCGSWDCRVGHDRATELNFNGIRQKAKLKEASGLNFTSFQKF